MIDVFWNWFWNEQTLKEISFWVVFAGGIYLWIIAAKQEKEIKRLQNEISELKGNVKA